MPTTISNGFEGKTALITGATSGIGLATARAFAERGARVVLAGRREREGEEAAGALRDGGHEAFFVRTDVTRPAEVRALVGATVERYGGLDFAFNNAGLEGDTFVPLHESTLENYDRVFDVNVRSVLTSMQAQIPVMLANGGGAIVNNASAAGLIGFGGMAIYSASKHAVVGLTRAAAVEYARQGLRINAVAPGAVATPMFDRFLPEPAEREAVLGMVPLGRVGRPEEIASAVLWLSDPANTFTVGAALAVDGGYTAQ
jgi:NAD(P)-dependent dehydrogenase (short-subunit alcohol dehydrogenase family)